jgi:hypothetical protein
MRGLGSLLLVGAAAIAAWGGSVALAGAASRLPLGGPVPARISATSVSFVSKRTAYVLGTAPCAHRPCTVILRTRDRGGSWTGLAAPRQRVSRPFGSGLWGVRFADARRGFAFGKGLWVTTDGAASWRRAVAPDRFVLDLAVVRGRELVAVTAPCALGSTPCSGRLTISHRAVRGGRWEPVATTGASSFDYSLAVHGRTVWVLAGTQLWVSTDGGHTFGSHRQPCAKSPDALPTPTSVADAGRHSYLLCTGEGFVSHTVKFVYRTSGTHSGWVRVSKPPTAGDGGLLATGSDHAIAIATASAASWTYLSRDFSHRWSTPLTFFDGGEGWADLGFTTGSEGAVIHGPARADGGVATSLANSS